MPSARPLALILCIALASHAHARKWTDATGKYSTEADLIARSDETAVLQRSNRELISVNIDQLLEADQQYLRSKELEQPDQSADSLHDWSLANGLKVRGRVVGYAQRELVLRRRGGKLYVNDRHVENLPEVYRRMLPAIVSHYTNAKRVDSLERVDAHMRARHGRPLKITAEGVQLQLENGDMYGVPFFMFSEQDRGVLEAGWQRWLAAEEYSPQREREDLHVESHAAAYQSQEQPANNQIAQLQLGLLATIAGVVDLWEVFLTPASGNGWPISVVVPAQNSLQATQAALAANPGYRAGPARKVN
jgi:hypothetical protein